MALVQSTRPGVKIINSTLVAAHPNWTIDGFVGRNTTFTRVNIYGVVDYVELTGGNVLIQDSWLPDNLYYSTTPAGHDTHSDSLQIQTGSNITVRNSKLTNSTNAAVMITQDRGSVSNFTFTNNYADHGACTINVAEKSHGPIRGRTIGHNTVGTHQKISRCAIIAPRTTSSISTITANYFTDRTPVKVKNG